MVQQRFTRVAPQPIRWLAIVCALWQMIQGNSSMWAAENLWLDAARISITSHELRDHVGVLANDMLEGREAGSRGGHAAARYLLHRLEEAALKPAGANGQFTQPFRGNSQNLLAKIEGSDPELRNEYVIVGAHYDHVGYGSRRNSYGPIGYIHNGADDNASGVATVLEVIDALTRADYRPRRSILFAFWDGEEKGLLGSKHWVAHPTVALDAVRLAINIDMVGRLVDGRIEVGGTRSGVGLRRMMSSSELSVGSWLDFSWEYKSNSDHWTFFQAGVSSLYLHTGLHEDYHRPSDDVEKLNMEGMCEVSRYLLGTLTKLADMERLPDFRSAARRETSHTQQRQERSLPPLASRLGFDWEYVSGRTIVTRLQQRTPAAEAGLLVGDRIIRVNGLPNENKALLPAIALPAESPVALEIERVGTDIPLTIRVAPIGNPIRLGLSWRADPAEPAAVYVTRVVPFSPAARAGIELKDRIYQIDGKEIRGQADLIAAVNAKLNEKANELILEIESRGVVREVTVSFELPSAVPADAVL